MEADEDPISFHVAVPIYILMAYRILIDFVPETSSFRLHVGLIKGELVKNLWSGAKLESRF